MSQAKFKILRNNRQKNSESKYIGLDGRNAAFGRDNLTDILEELADANNIVDLTQDRIALDTTIDRNSKFVFLGLLQDLGSSIRKIADHCYYLRDMLPEHLKSEGDVDRSSNEEA